MSIYLMGRRGVVGAARLAGRTLGSSVSRARRTRGQLQKQLTEAQTEEQREMSMRLQRNMWKARMIANEVTMVRNLSPRLLHKGNFGFTQEELLDAVSEAAGRGRRASSEARGRQIEAHATRQLEMEGKSISDPAMYPLTGRHGSSPDVPGAPAREFLSRGSDPGSVSELEPELQRFHWTNHEVERA